MLDKATELARVTARTPRSHPNSRHIGALMERRPAPASIAREIAWGVDGLADQRQYFDSMLMLLERTFPSDAIGWNSVDQSTGVASVHGNPPEIYEESGIPAEVLATVRDHPMIVSYGREWSPGGMPMPRPRRMSDVVSRHDLRRTVAYAELLGPIRADRQFTILTAYAGPGVGTCWTFALDRGDFSDGTMELAIALQPLLVSLERAQDALFAAHRPRAVDDHGLTPREIEVLALVAEGLTASAIGSVLRISTLTVRKHLENTYRKLGENDRLLAVRRAQEFGLIRR